MSVQYLCFIEFGFDRDSFFLIVESVYKHTTT